MADTTRPGGAAWPDDPNLRHVSTDGSTRHERRQTFSGWAARAVQPQTRQVRQVSGARPGGTSLEAETEAILAGLRLVPGGASARLSSDLDLPALLGILESPVGEAARHHLRGLWVQPVARNSGRDSRAVHHVARASEQEAREGTVPDGSGLAGAVLGAQDLARAGQADLPLALGGPRLLPGGTGPLPVRVLGCDFGRGPGGQVRATLTLTLGPVPGAGRHEAGALADALRRGLTPLVRGGVVELGVPERWAPAATDALSDLGLVRVRPQPESGQDGPA